ncbi:MAG: rod shape-determining protein MreD [Pygmaiobacter massiliensis]|jgi:rod shape-determining protein MreD|nr:rod shape-determining protein MreD [Pygmaiobacter massiliensis]
MDPRKRTAQAACKHLCYLALVFLFYLLQTWPGLLTVASVKPAWLVPLAVCIAAREGEFVGALYGAFAGLLWEVSAGRTSGALAIPLLFLCFFVGIAVTLYLQGNLLNLSLLTLAAAFLVTGIDHVFTYWLQGRLGSGGIYLRYTLPTVFYTALVTAVAWYLVRAVWRKFLVEE